MLWGDELGETAAQRQTEAAYRADLENWMAKEQRRLTGLVAQQRIKRDAETKSSLEGIAQALAVFLEGDKPGTRADALSGPPADLTGAIRDSALLIPGGPAGAQLAPPYKPDPRHGWVLF
jgi:hypothetical protein